MIASFVIVVFIVVGVISLIVATRSTNPDAREYSFIVTIGATLTAFVIAGITSIYSQPVGVGSVVVNAGGTVAGQNLEPGFATKAPWQSRNIWTLISQSVTYAGDGQAPTYTKGNVQGDQVTASAKGGAQTEFDFSAVYNLNGDNLSELYEQFRSQDTFTAQIVEPSILSVVRDVPSAYTPVQLRGEKRMAAQAEMLDRLNEQLAPWGVTFSTVNLQNITFSPDVEDSIKAVEVAQQNEAKAQAELRATEVSAQAQVVEAQAQAKANVLLAESLTPALLQQRWIDAIRESGNTIVVPDGSAPLINVPTHD